MKKAVRFHVNGTSTTLETDDERTLLWALRTDLGLTGTKFGCGAGLCGACTVVVDGTAVRSCQTSLKEVVGRHVLTIEGLAQGGTLHPLQQAFIDNGGFQCGFCTSGMIMNAVALLEEHPHASPEAIVKGMEDNLCRCGAHKRIVAAVAAVAGANGASS